MPGWIFKDKNCMNDLIWGIESGIHNRTDFFDRFVYLRYTMITTIYKEFLENRMKCLQWVVDKKIYHDNNHNMIIPDPNIKPKN